MSVMVPFLLQLLVRSRLTRLGTAYSYLDKIVAISVAVQVAAQRVDYDRLAISI